MMLRARLSKEELDVDPNLIIHGKRRRTGIASSPEKPKFNLLMKNYEDEIDQTLAGKK